MKKSEIWKPVAGYEGFYEASDLGRVRSVDRLIVTSAGRKMRLRGKLLKQNRNGSGYLQCCLSTPQKRENLFVHRVVAATFHGPIPNGMEVRHRDGDKENNQADNLCFGTRKQNMEDCRRHGTIAAGERNGLSHLTEADVVDIREKYAGGASADDLASYYMVCSAHILGITCGTYWKSAGGPIRKVKDTRGEGSNFSKLTESDVREIRRLISDGKSNKEISALFGVVPSTIYLIKTRRNWSHID